MTRRTSNILVAIGVLLAASFAIGGYFINKYYHQKVKSGPMKYCYQVYYGPPNPVLIIEDLDYADVYIDYYQGLENKEKKYIEFPIKTLPISFPVYVVGYSKDSSLIEVVSYYNNEKQQRGGGFTKGWVYAKTLHDKPPVKSRSQ